MNRYTAFLFLFFLNAAVILAQQDPEARKILDRFKDRATSSYPIRMDFSYTYESHQEDYAESEQGYLILDDKRFKLILPDMHIFCDGETFWNYLVESNEVYISDPEEAAEDDFLLTNPASLFKLYHENFKYRLKGETEIENTGLYDINLHPYDLDRSYHTINLLITRSGYELYSMKTLEKHGSSYTVLVTEYNSRYQTDEQEFVFDSSKHPDVMVVDTRL